MHRGYCGILYALAQFTCLHPQALIFRIMTMHNLRTITSPATFVTLLVALILLAPNALLAAPECVFERDLDIGDEGTDVFCLQEWLNTEGYVLAESGPGSPGYETTRFGGLTRDALARWQEDNDVSPASGYFGPKTRGTIEALAALVGNTTGIPADLEIPQIPEDSAVEDDIAAMLSLLSPEDQAQAEQLMTLLRSLGITKSTNQTTSGEESELTVDDLEPTKTTVRNSRSDIEDLILDAISMIREAKDMIDEEDADDASMIAARANYEDAQEDLMDAIYAYFTGDDEEAYGAVDGAFDNAEDAFTDAGGTTDEDEVEERIDELEDDIDEAREELEDDEDDGADVDDALDELEEAEALLDEAKDAEDDEEWSRALDLLDEVEDRIDEAYDAVVSEEERDAQEAIDDAWDAYKDARAEVREAEDDGDDVDDAEAFLEMAKDALDDADDAIDDGKYDDALDYADDAERYADDAVDSL